jgi:hypothetical protein
MQDSRENPTATPMCAVSRNSMALYRKLDIETGMVEIQDGGLPTGINSDKLIPQLLLQTALLRS